MDTVYHIANHCGPPLWSIGVENTSGDTVPGDTVTTILPIAISGVWASLGTLIIPSSPPAFPPPINVRFQGMDVMTFDPALGAISGFSASQQFSPAYAGPGGQTIYYGPWSAVSSVSLSGILLATGTNPYPDGLFDSVVPPYDSIYLYTGPSLISEGDTIDLVWLDSSASQDFSPTYHFDSGSGTWIQNPSPTQDFFTTQAATGRPSPFYWQNVRSP